MTIAPHHDARILIVDDQQTNLDLLERLLQREGYDHIFGLTNPFEVLSVFCELNPDLLLLDLHMPGLDGFDVMDQLRPLIPADNYIPILVLTADITTEVKRRALAGGAKDFLTKPFDAVEVILRIENLLETRFLHLRLRDQNLLLEERVQERTRELVRAEYETIDRLARAAEYRDDATGQHAARVATMSTEIARRLAMADDDVELLRHSSSLHDVGKIGIPDSILLKPDHLTVEERAIMQTHTILGAAILSSSQSPLLRMAEAIALTHHEWWNGNGYPHRLKGEEIPLVGRIVGLADVFDALINRRPYKPAWPIERAREEVLAGGGSQFDPRLVEAFHDLMGHEQSLYALYH